MSIRLPRNSIEEIEYPTEPLLPTNRQCLRAIKTLQMLCTFHGADNMFCVVNKIFRAIRLALRKEQVDRVSTWLDLLSGAPFKVHLPELLTPVSQAVNSDVPQTCLLLLHTHAGRSTCR